MELSNSGHGQEGLSFAGALPESLVCGVLVVDAQGRIVSACAEAARSLGQPLNQLLQASFESLPRPLQEAARQSLAGGGSASRQPIELKVPGGGCSRFRVSAVPADARHPAAGMVLVLSNVTAAQEFETSIEQLDRLASLGTLAAGMAHEIRNALVAGKTFVDLLLEKHQNDELCAVTARELKRIDAIVSSMLKFAGSSRSAFAPVSVSQVLEHALQLVETSLEAKQITLQRSLGAAPDQVQGDEYALEQAFLNLLLNAVEAMGPGGTLSLATEILSPSAPRLCIRIEDTGTGIAPEDLSRLFEPFFTTKPTGTGLGLPITRRIIHEHHGQIEVESQPGRGTTFRILLPVG